ncbi:MAG: radical SAM family heme chaperone HemW [Agriterribacter sp.]
MAGIYIHIPFCKQACLYCNFHFSTSLQHKNDLLHALLKEINIRSNPSETIQTIYFGGGTPSLLNYDELSPIFSALYKNFNIAADAEITLEANPDDISRPILQNWKQSGINRLSIGVQSFFETDLAWMNRAHTAIHAKNCIVEAQGAGFDNLSIDLIYGTPTLPDENWKINVDTATSLGVPHISCYALTVEPKTALDSLIKKKKMQDTDAEQQSRQFLQLIDWLKTAGYEHYEISNFSLPQKRSRHNTSYWQNKPYYGFGPSSHSFNGSNIRSWNIANNAAYITALNKNMLPVEEEILTGTQQFNEYIMTSIRTMEGIDLHYLLDRFGAQSANTIIKKLQPYLHSKVIVNDTNITLTSQGKLFADGIAADLFEE